MVAVSGSMIAVCVFGLLAIGGAGGYAILKAFNGGEDFAPLESTGFGFNNWRCDSRSLLLGVNFDFNGDDAIFEIGIVVVVCVLIFACFCCGCGALHGCACAPKCLRDKQRRRRNEKRIKRIKKRRMKEEEELTEQERRRRKHERRQRNFERRLREGHWKTRGYSGSQRRRMLEERRKREQDKETKEETEDTVIEMEDTGTEVGERLEAAGSPDVSLYIHRDSMGSASSGSTLWAVRRGSDIYSPESRLSFHEKSERKKETVLDIEEE